MHAVRRMLTLALLATCCGCAGIRKAAVRSVASSLAKSGDVFSSDEDPQLVEDALPFALKTYESILAQTPRHEGLLVATAKGFTSYSEGFVARDAELAEDEDVAAGEALRRRAQKLDVRGRDYALRALDVAHPGLAAELRAGHLDGLARTDRTDVPALFWCAASWGAAITILKDDTDLISDVPAVKACVARVLELDETYEHGAAHEVMMRLEAGLSGGSLDRARRHYERAVALSDGLAASPHVAFAESACVRARDRRAFLNALDQALVIVPDARKDLSVANRLAQARARWLKARVDDLFIE